MADMNALVDGYWEKPTRVETWSGVPLKEIYTPEDMKAIDYETDIKDAGEYPFTRGIHTTMYRGRLWTRREVTGYGTAQNTNERLKFQILHGASVLDTIVDIPSGLGLDPDHPLAQEEVGMCGVSLCSLDDMEELLKDIPIDKISIVWVVGGYISPVVLAQYLALAEMRGVNAASLRGSMANKPSTLLLRVSHQVYSPTRV